MTGGWEGGGGLGGVGGENPWTPKVATPCSGGNSKEEAVRWAGKLAQLPSTAYIGGGDCSSVDWWTGLIGKWVE